MKWRSLTLLFVISVGGGCEMTDTFLDFAESLVSERAGWIRGVSKERNRFDLHVRTASFAPKLLTEIRPRDIGEWHREMIAKRAADRRGDRPLSKHTIERCHALVSVVFGEALRRELVLMNPCVGQKLRMPKGDADTEEKWAFLTLDEQTAIKACATIPAWDRWGMQFAWGTGLRQGEQCNLELRDVHTDGAEPHVIVRFGSPGKPTKSGKTRRVPLFGDALEAAGELVTIAGTVPNPHGLLFPSRTGSRRSVGKALGRGTKIDGKWIDPFHRHLRAAGVERHLRWHDLRHTCASSLIMGTWGRARALAEIRDLLGHSSVSITERYAHLGDDALKRMARELDEDARARAASAPAAVDVSAVMAKGPNQVRLYGWRHGFFDLVKKRVRRVFDAVMDVGADERVA